jgi:hypothetical protein
VWYECRHAIEGQEQRLQRVGGMGRQMCTENVRARLGTAESGVWRKTSGSAREQTYIHALAGQKLLTECMAGLDSSRPQCPVSSEAYRVVQTYCRGWFQPASGAVLQTERHLLVLDPVPHATAHREDTGEFQGCVHCISLRIWRHGTTTTV